MRSLVLLTLTAPVQGYDRDGCTSIVVSSGATVDGSAMTSHSDDCSDCDWRMAYVPARDHEAGAMRAVHDGSWGQYPRLVEPERSAIYTPGAGINESLVIGSLPQVPHTFALWESSYSLMNEHGLGMGESTCAAYLVGKSPKEGGTSLLAVRTLMMLGLERCATARCAISTMGELAAQYGFYGEDPGMGGAGEAVTLVDRQGEAWIFHVTGGVPAKQGEEDRWAGQRGALWAAQRVPDGHVAVVANVFIIKEVDPTDSENFMLHPGLLEMAQEAGLWDGKEPFNFQKHMQPDQTTFADPPGTPPIPMYGTLRTWGVFRHAAPSANISITEHIDEMPFSVQVDRLVDHNDVFRWFRESFYEGTEFDMTLGVLAGPFQSPNRVEGGHGMAVVQGQFARAISIHRTSYTSISQSGIAEPVVWFAPDKPSTSVFVPFFASALHGDGGAGKHDQKLYGEGSMKSFSFTDGTLPAWWAFDFVANWMDLCYRNMSQTYVYPAVLSLQAEVDAGVKRALTAAASARDASEASVALAEAQTGLQRHVAERWWELAAKLVVRYNDMSFNFPEHAPTVTGSVGLPAFWLEMIGFSNENYFPTWVAPAAEPPLLLPEGERAALGLAAPQRPRTVEISVSALAGMALATVAGLFVASALSYRLGKSARRVSNKDPALGSNYERFLH